jgi:uncharacterized protein YjbI with pentapeptide repeats
MPKFVLALAIIALSFVLYRYYMQVQKDSYMEQLASPERSCVACDLSEQDLRYRDLRGYDLTNANLLRADISCADLSLANLSGATLREANITGTILTGARLTRDTDMARVIWDDGTKCDKAQ